MSAYDVWPPRSCERVSVADQNRASLFEAGTGELEPTLYIFIPLVALIFSHSVAHFGVQEAQTPSGLHSQLQLLC